MSTATSLGLGGNTPEPEADAEKTQPPVADEPVAHSLDPDPLDRSLDRFLAQQGALDDAAPLFAPGENMAWVGVLLAIPALVAPAGQDLIHLVACLRDRLGLPAEAREALTR